MRAGILFLLASLALCPAFETFGPERSFPRITPRVSFLSDAEAVTEDLKQNLHWRGPAAWYDMAEDSFYIKPTKEDLEQFLKFFKYHREQDRYSSQSWDCDDFARMGIHLGRLFGNRYYRGSEGAFMVGAAYVRIIKDYESRGRLKSVKTFGKGELHVLNFLGLADGTWLFFEPQTMELTPLEKGLEQFEILKLQF